MGIKPVAANLGITAKVRVTSKEETDMNISRVSVPKRLLQGKHINI